MQQEIATKCQLMLFKEGQITQKPRGQEMFFLIGTHRLIKLAYLPDEIYPFVKFHNYLMFQKLWRDNEL